MATGSSRHSISSSAVESRLASSSDDDDNESRNHRSGSGSGTSGDHCSRGWEEGEKEGCDRILEHAALELYEGLGLRELMPVVQHIEGNAEEDQRELPGMYSYINNGALGASIGFGTGTGTGAGTGH